jgi:hypothetical protein
MIIVDLTGATPTVLAALPRVTRDIVVDLVWSIHSEILSLAQKKLTSASDDYKRGLQEPEFSIKRRLPSNPTTIATIVLVGWLPNAVEHGWEGGDMKAALLSGRAVKQGENGPYVTVPFRHMGPGATGRHGAPMGSQHAKAGTHTREEAARLGRRIMRMTSRANMAGSTTHASGAATKWGDRLPAGQSPKLRSHHKTDIHAGMVRMSKDYKSGSGDMRMTFRRVSQNSDPRAWIHPGIEGRHLFRDAVKEIPRIAERLFDQAFRGIGHSTGAM